MNIPGFGAEASLYKSGQSYRTGGTFDQSLSAIQPARYALPCSYCRDLSCLIRCHSMIGDVSWDPWVGWY